MRHLFYACLLLLTLGALPAISQVSGNQFSEGQNWLIGSIGHFNPRATADFNGDGAIDLIGQNGIIWLNDGHGAFTAADTLRGLAFVPDTGYCDGAAADLDGDGDIDFVGYAVPDAGYPFWVDSVRIRSFQNDGQGHFILAGGLTVPDHEVIQLLVDDFDGDALPDLLLLAPFDSTQQRQLFRLRLNNGLGTAFGGPDFRLPTGGARYFTCQSADLNHDGKSDLIVSCGWPLNINYGDSLQVWLNQGNATWQPQPRQIRYGRGGNLLPAQDLNADGSPDLIAVCQDQPYLELLLNDGAGHLTSHLRPIARPYPHLPVTTVITADVDSDGDPDLLFWQWNKLQVMENVAPAQWRPSQTLYTVHQGWAQVLALVVPADVDGDGDSDLLLNYYPSGPAEEAQVLYNQNITGLAEAPTTAPLALAPNPATHRVALTTTPSPEAQSVQVLDALGRTVLMTHLEPQTSHLELPLTGLPAGVYVVRVGAAARRLVVE